MNAEFPAPYAQEVPKGLSSLFFKVIISLLVSLLPISVLFALYAHILPLHAFFGASALLHGTAFILGLAIPNNVLFFIGSFAISLALGSMTAHALFLKRITYLLSYVTTMRTRKFKQLPVLPPIGEDEIGQLGKSISFAALEFGNMRQQADSANDQRTLFLMTAAHQLRTPLSELIWAIEDVRTGKGTPEEKGQLLESVDGTLKRMRLIMEHLLSGAGVEEGKFGYVFESIDVIPLVSKIVAEFKPVSERRKVELFFGAPASAFSVYADAERISLVLYDLISNAFNYTPSGGNIVVSATPAEERMQVSVADTGIGMSENERKLLFNKFYRSERARHMHPDGSGLGLFLAKNILEKHGSELLIESQEGKGTKMSFYLHAKKENIPR